MPFSVTPPTRLLRQLIGFSARETRGFGVVLAGLAVLVVGPALVGQWLTAPAASPVTADDVRALNQVAARLEQAEATQRRARYATTAGARSWEVRPAAEPARRWGASGGYGGSGGSGRRGAGQPAAPVALLKTLTVFDPNTLSAVEWQRRGVPADVARRIVSYGTKAGGFRYREQLARIHGLDPALLARLEPFMQLPTRADAFGPRPVPAGYGGQATARFANHPAGANSLNAPTSPNGPAGAAAGGGLGTPANAAGTPPAYASAYRAKARVVQPFDLNTADTLTLMQLRGIGQRRAARIVELREKLGGFVSPAQLADVWGLDPALVDSLAKYGRVAADFHPRLLTINSATIDELKAHPYVGPRLARIIAAYRDQHGPFARPEDLRQIRVIEDATYQKLVPYLAMR